jgi:hypothetical protein
VTYTVTDTSNNIGTATRTVHVVDSNAPVITLLGDATVTLECGATYTDAGATANDACQGDLTASIQTSSAANTSAAGSYTITYTVSDSSGNAATPVTRTVQVNDTTAPVISLIGEATMNVVCHGVFTDPGATATDGCNGDLTASIQVAGTVDTETAGQYTLTYSVSDASGNAATPVTRTVTVQACKHSADENGDGKIDLSELLRVIQFFNMKGYHCMPGSEDGYAPGPGATNCTPHSSDYNPQDWKISLSELLRVIQFFNIGGYHPCPGQNTEDGFCPGP